MAMLGGFCFTLGRQGGVMTSTAVELENAWDYYELCVQEAMHLPEGTSQRNDALARCQHWATVIDFLRGRLGNHEVHDL